MFCGLSAFPLTPMNEVGVDEGAFVRLVERLTVAKVDSIGALGSTGSYVYLNRSERFRVAQLAVEHAGGIPVVAAKLRVERLRALIPARVTIGVSGDAFAATGLSAGCEAWYSVVGGLFPKTALAITQAVRTGNINEANRLSDRLEPLWTMFRRKGSVRVMATAAELQGLVSNPSLPLPLRGLEGIERQELQSLLAKLELTE
jgi:4-hydroxy-tetrahydrodipicolinate synthase